MPSSDVKLLSPDAESFGVNVARTQRLIAKLLADWVEEGSQRDRGRAGRSFLTTIYFDKLAGLFCGVWDEMARRGHVRYVAAFRKQRGFHGPGRALQINRTEDRTFGADPDDLRRHQWAFTTEIMEKLHPALGEAGALFRLDGQAWHADCRVYPGIVQSQWDEWLKQGDEFLTATEVNYFIELSHAISVLDEDELRALGTHSSAGETLADIKFNLSAWENAFRQLLKQLPKDGDDKVIRYAYRLVVTMREVKKKSGENRAQYVTALPKLCGACNDSGSVKSIIHLVQQEGTRIWDQGEVQRFAAAAGPLLDFSLYTRRALHSLRGVRSLKDRELAEASEAMGRLHNPFPGVTLNPTAYDEVATLNKEIWCEELRRNKEILFRQIPVIDSFEEFGVPV